MEGRLDASRRVLFSLGSVETSFTLLSLQAGLLTFPSLLYLPDNVVSGVIRADLINGDYSCRYSSGLSPDSLASGGYRHQISICVCKDTIYFGKHKKNIEKNISYKCKRTFLLSDPNPMPTAACHITDCDFIGFYSDK